MALIKCSECGKEISDKSKVCINCGSPIKEKSNKKILNWLKRHYVIFIVIIALFVVFTVVKTFLYSPFMINGDTMSPTLKNGEIKILDKRAKINRYDVIVFEYENSSIIRRVYGMPGETVVVENGSIYINDKKIEDKYGYGETIGEADITLKENEYFVLADNRDESKPLDSRNIKYSGYTVSTGPIKKEMIMGVLLNVD